MNTGFHRPIQASDLLRSRLLFNAQNNHTVSTNEQNKNINKEEEKESSSSSSSEDSDDQQGEEALQKPTQTKVHFSTQKNTEKDDSQTSFQQQVQLLQKRINQMEKELHEKIQNAVHNINSAEQRFDDKVDKLTKIIHKTKSGISTEHSRLYTILQDLIQNIKEEKESNEHRFQALVSESEEKIKGQIETMQTESVGLNTMLSDVNLLLQSPHLQNEDQSTKKDSSSFWNKLSWTSSSPSQMPPTETSSRESSKSPSKNKKSRKSSPADSEAHKKNGKKKKNASPKKQRDSPPPSTEGPALRTRSQTRKSEVKKTGSCLLDELVPTQEEDKSSSSSSLQAFEDEVYAWGNTQEDEKDDPHPTTEAIQGQEEEDEEDLEPCSEGFHQMLHYIILHLRTKTLQSHAELDEVITPLSEVAKLDYPTANEKPDILDRQAVILKLITCFYQTVCVISMEENIPPEKVYANEDMLLIALHRVHAML